jgi:glycosyltransferase involved in cell wall biosynthesis
LIDDPLRVAMGRNGRDYIRKYYRWDVIMAKYDRLLAKIRAVR